MPNIYQPGLLQVRPQYTYEADAANTPENVLWFESATHSTPSQANLVSIAGTFDTNWSGVFLQYAGEGAYYTGSIITDWSSDTGIQWTTVGTFEPEDGTQGALVPPQVAALVSYQVPLRWRGGHFRTYLPYVGSSVVDGSLKDQLSPTCQTNLADNINDVITNMKDTGILGGQTFVCYKDKTNAEKAATYQISSFTVNPQLATQRRRIRKVTRK